MKIQFVPTNNFITKHEILPTPAMKQIPSWFGEIPTFVNEDKKFKLFSNGKLNATIKWCNPFIDGLSAGYHLLLSFDLQVTKENGESLFTWRIGGEDLVSMHSKQQVSIKMIPEGYNTQPYKFRNDWGVKTPQGYSSLFMHPVNRTDLPFITLTGVVDTDSYSRPVNLPFVIRDDFEGIIKAGTPIAQIVPIKREVWEHEICAYDEVEVQKKDLKFYQHIYRAYKNYYWHKKEYR